METSSIEGVKVGHCPGMEPAGPALSITVRNVRAHNLNDELSGVRQIIYSRLQTKRGCARPFNQRLDVFIQIESPCQTSRHEGSEPATECTTSGGAPPNGNVPRRGSAPKRNQTIAAATAAAQGNIRQPQARSTEHLWQPALARPEKL